MPDVRTEVTEIVTALGMTARSSVDEALRARPSVVRHVTDTHWDRITVAYEHEDYPAEFTAEWQNGRSFLMSTDGLRGRVPAVMAGDAHSSTMSRPASAALSKASSIRTTERPARSSRLAAMLARNPLAQCTHSVSSGSSSRRPSSSSRGR